MKGANGLSLLSACMLFLTISIYPAFSEEIILCTHDNYTRDNCTLQVEDIDSQAEKVWLVMLAGQGPSLSMVLGINDTLTCSKLTIMVARIYAGDSADIVRLNINVSG
jgi:hypothetical protein